MVGKTNVAGTYVKGSQSGSLVTSFKAEIGKYYFLHCVYALTQYGLSGCTIINTTRGEAANGIDSTGYLVKATSTTIRATKKFGWHSVE